MNGPHHDQKARSHTIHRPPGPRTHTPVGIRRVFLHRFQVESEVPTIWSACLWVIVAPSPTANGP